MKENTVFIIDDDPSARSGLLRLLRTARLNAESFATARDFLDAEHCNDPGCILLDVQMPEMTGPELHDVLIKAGCNLPIVFLSAHGDVPTTARAMKNGVVDFLTKPVDRVELLEAVQRSFVKDAEYRAKLASNSSFNSLLKTLTPREYGVMAYVISGLLNMKWVYPLKLSRFTVAVLCRSSGLYPLLSL